MHNFYFKMLYANRNFKRMMFWKFLIERTKKLLERVFTLSNKIND